MTLFVCLIALLITAGVVSWMWGDAPQPKPTPYHPPVRTQAHPSVGVVPPPKVAKRAETFSAPKGAQPQGYVAPKETLMETTDLNKLLQFLLDTPKKRAGFRP